VSIAAGIGWWIGWAVALVVILLAAALLLAIIGLGRRIVRQADDITAALDGVRDHTTPLFDVTRTNFAIDRISRDLRVVRTGEPDEPDRARHEPTEQTQQQAGPVEALRDAWRRRGR
jgi:hypothetical protein